MSTKKSDLKSELADLLLNDEDAESSISKVLNTEPVTIGAPDETHALQIKHEKAIEQKNKHDSFKKPAIVEELPLAPMPVAGAVAQSRIDQLELEVDRVRKENEKLEATANASKSQVDEMSKRLLEWEKRYKDTTERKDLDLQLAREELGHKGTRLEEATKQLEELESRFEGEFHRIRVRERELQNRLDILKHEGSAVVRHKDELILELKRQIEKMNYEMESFRKKNQGVYGQVEAQHDRMKRAMKAMRVAVSLLDGEEEKPLKKAE